jgi:hypothetical protein
VGRDKGGIVYTTCVRTVPRTANPCSSSVRTTQAAVKPEAPEKSTIAGGFTDGMLEGMRVRGANVDPHTSGVSLFNTQVEMRLGVLNLHCHLAYN